MMRLLSEDWFAGGAKPSGRRRLVRSMALEVEHLHAGYTRNQDVLRGVSFTIQPGERVGLLGRNGAGKSTLLRTLTGELVPGQGQVRYGGESLTGLRSHEVARLGVASVLQGRVVFPDLTVEQNLRLGAVAHAPNGFAVTAVLGAFPWLESRFADRADRLSGGQQQQLAIARALVGGPGLLLLDEPLAGIQASVADDLIDALRRISTAWSMSLLLVEQDVDAAMRCCDRILFMEHGAVVDGATVAALRVDGALIERYLGL